MRVLLLVAAEARDHLPDDVEQRLGRDGLLLLLPLAERDQHLPQLVRHDWTRVREAGRARLPLAAPAAPGDCRTAQAGDVGD